MPDSRPLMRIADAAEKILAALGVTSTADPSPIPGLVYVVDDITEKSAEYTYALTDEQKSATVHQISVNPSAGATGTVTPYVKALNSSFFEPLIENGSVIVIDLSSPRTVEAYGVIDEVKLTPTSLVGTFTPKLCGRKGGI